MHNAINNISNIQNSMKQYITLCNQRGRKRIQMFLATVTLCLLCGIASTMQAQSIQLTVSNTVVDTTKVYNGTTTANILSLGTLTGVLEGDSVTLAATASFSSKNVGTNKPVVVEYTIGGPDSASYLAPVNDTFYADITPRPLTIRGTMLDTSKVYNGTTSIGITIFGTLLGVIPGDTVYRSILARFMDPWAGYHKPVVITYSLYGKDRNNYLDPEPDSSHFASILRKPIQCVDVTLPDSIEYTGTWGCPIIDSGRLDGVLPIDTVYHRVFANTNNAECGIKDVTIHCILSGPQSDNYIMGEDTSSHSIVIYPRQLYAIGAEVQLVKQYDGTDTAIVTTEAEILRIVYGMPTVNVTTKAYYDDALPRDNKRITLHYEIMGEWANLNYFAPPDSIYSTEGRIIMPTTLVPLGDNGEQIVPTKPQGFCHNTQAAIHYTLGEGEPLEYRLTFDSAARAQGFVNTDWQNLNDADTLRFDIPAGCQFGHYNVSVEFRNVAMGTTEPITATFTVSFMQQYIIQVFDDVLSVDNSGRIDNTPNRFSGYQWYRDGDAITNANKPYYQEISGLDGNYSVHVTLTNGDSAWVCPATAKSAPRQPKVYVTPSPVKDEAQVKLQGLESGHHSLTIYNSYGQSVMQSQFDGKETTLRLGTLPQGTYIIDVDGFTVKTLKL